MEHNPKDREYYCEKCKTFVILRAMNPLCVICSRTLYVASRSLIDGSRITGNDELVKSDFRPTSGARKS